MREADNHLGWIVQVLPVGKPWGRVGAIKETKQEAITSLLEYKRMWPDMEYRVYELVKGM